MKEYCKIPALRLRLLLEASVKPEPTLADGMPAALIDGSRGDSAAFAALGSNAEGAWILIEQDELKDIDGLFREYAESGQIEARAWRARALGVVYTGSRPHNLLYRHNMNLGYQNRDHLGLVMERDAALRALRLLRSGVRLSLNAVLDLQRGPAYESANVVGEIKGSSRPDEIVRDPADGKPRRRAWRHAGAVLH